MKSTRLMAGALVLTAIISGFCATTNDATSSLQKGLFEEEANHNLGAAIRFYQSVVTQFDKDRKLAATAIFRLGECYRKQGSTNEAIAQYERILREFPEEPQLTGTSRQNLLALGRNPVQTTSTFASPSKSGGDEQRQLLQQEIKLVEQQLTTEQKRIESGNATPDSIIPTQRELLGLKRQLAALDASAPVARDILAVPGEPVASTSTEAEEVKRIQAMIKDSPDLINAPDSSGNRSTPLIKAAMQGQIIVARFLISAGADVESKDSNGWTPLYWAASQGYKGFLELLLASKAQPDNPNNKGKTPLHAAAEKGFRSIAEVLLANGAKVNSPDQEKATPLHYAIVNGFRAVAEVLLDKGADVNARAGSVIAPGNKYFAGTPLCIAATRGDLVLTELLLSHKADPELAGPAGSTPLDAAGTGNHAQVAEALLSHGAKVDIMNTNEEYRGWTALHYAVSAGAQETVDLLLKNKADPNARIETGFNAQYNQPLMPGQRPPQATGYTPLLIATAKCYSGIVNSLLGAGGDPNLKSDAGDTPIINSMTRCDSPERAKILSLLLDHGTATEAKDRFDQTALILAAANKDKNCLELLLKRKANPNARAQSGATPLHYVTFALDQPALYSVLVAMAKDLIDAGADVNAQDSDGRTPLKLVTDLLARSSSNTVREPLKEFAELLRKAGAVDDLPRLDRIEVARSSAAYSSPVFWKAINEYNRFTLFEFIAVAYQLCTAPPAPTSGTGQAIPGRGLRTPMPSMGAPIPIALSPSSSSGALSFPDFSRVVIRRATRDGKNRLDTRVDLAAAFNSGTCSGDQPLKWGDVVDIPEADHPISATWQGLSENTRALIGRCLARTVEVRVKGQTTNMFLKPAASTRPGEAKGDFSLISTLNGSGLLRASSDLSRVKVTRHDPDSGQTYELQLDCSSSGTGYGLWLRDGDVIEVPEKP